MSILSTADEKDSQLRPKPKAPQDEILTEEQVVEEIKALLNLALKEDLSEERKTRLNLLEKLHEIGRAVGYTTVKCKQDDDVRIHGTVFHYGGGFLYTCAHVVHDDERFSGMGDTFEWMDLKSGKPVTRKYPQCDCLTPAVCSHRFGILKKSTPSREENDLAMFREDKTEDLPAIQVNPDLTVELKIFDQVTPEATEATPSPKETEELYHIFWNRR